MTKKSGIYTKGGDKGETSLIGGRRVSKNHPSIEAYGTVDELMAHTALLRDLVDDPDLKEELLVLLDYEMVTSSWLATGGEDYSEMLPRIGTDQVAFLEQRIDDMDASLEPLHSFIIPGGHPAISQAHVARTVCRRAERNIFLLQDEIQVEEAILQFYNRLSDYFFVLSRKIAKLQGIPQKPWKSML